MNVLVTGGSGFIGRNIVKVLKEQGNEVGSLDIKEKNSVADYPSPVKFSNSGGDVTAARWKT